MPPERCIQKFTAAAGAAVVCLAGCVTHQHAAIDPLNAPRDNAAIRRFAEAYARSFQSGDADAVVALMTEDFVALTPGKPPVIGKQAVREEVAADLRELEVHELRFEPAEIEVRGDWAWVWGRSEAAMKQHDAGENIRVEGKFLWILQRQANGTWRIARDSAHGS